MNKVGIVMGSASDLPVMREAAEILAELAVPCEVVVASAHRTPERLREWVADAERRGVRAFIAGAGGAAHLAGSVAALTTRPTIGVPIASTPLAGFDALLATVQMPGGIPVATVAIGTSGAINAALLAAQMLAISDDALGLRLTEYRQRLVKKVEDASAKVAEEMATISARRGVAP